MKIEDGARRPLRQAAQRAGRPSELEAQRQAYGHDLGAALPVHGVVQRVAQLVEEAAALHLLQVDGRQHQAEQEEQRLHDDDLLGVERRAMPRDEHDEAGHHHHQSPTKRDARPTDGRNQSGNMRNTQKAK